MSLALTNHSNGHWHGSASGTILYTTSTTNEIIVLFIFVEPNHLTGEVPVSTVVDTHGLTWARRTKFHAVFASTTDANVEEWWAASPTALSGTITVTMTASIDAAAMVTASISGCPSASAPWDTNVSLPVTASALTGTIVPVTGTMNTSAADTFVFGVFGTIGGSAETDTLAAVDTVIDSAGTQFANINVQGQEFTSAQSGLTVTFTPNRNVWLLVLDALSGSAGVVLPTIAQARIVG